MRASAMAIIALAAACSSTPRAAGPGPSSGPPSASEGVVAFATVQAVLQHPRCQNCHPAGDAPLQGDDGHVHLQYVKRGPLGRGEVGQECSTCHGPANPPSNYGLHIPPGVSEGWRMPPPDAPLVFVGRAPRELCEQLKDPAQTGGKDLGGVRAHLDTPLVTWGWDPGFGRAPVATPRAEFLAAFERWVAAGAPCPE